MKSTWLLFLLGLTVVNGDLSHIVVSENEMFQSIPSVRSICGGLGDAWGITKQCAEQLDIVCGNLSLLVSIFDASSKFPYPGLYHSTKMDLGNFDQCITVKHEYEHGRILGEYCTVGLTIPDPADDITDPSTYFKLSVCRPDACSASDYNAIIQNTTNFSLPLFQDIMCQTVETYKDFDAGDIGVLTLFAIFIAAMIMSTAYDMHLYYNQLKNNNPLLTAFSVLSNGRKLFHISPHSKSKEQVETFHGLRVISTMWIVAGHGFVAWQMLPVTNKETVDTWLQNKYGFYISAGPLAVDTFFYMSGFLLAFQYLKMQRKSPISQIASIPHMYLHRYLRLTPAMMMIYLAFITFFKHLGSGPLWSSHESLAQPCKDHWWSFFLYFQNYYNYDNICLTQTWYLSADMQMFLLSPLVLIPISITLKKRTGFKISMAELLVLNIFCTFMPMVIKLCFRDYTNAYDTHSRLIGYFIGVMMGVFMREKIDKPFLYTVKENYKSVANLVIWAVILLGMSTIILCYQEIVYGLNHKYETISVFYSLMRPAWCIGLCWITYSCYHGYGGFVNWILCRPIFQVLGRLTYCIYLVHGSVISYYVLDTKLPWFFTNYDAFYLFCGHYIVSVIVAIFWTLAFESPLIIIEKYLTGRDRKSAQPSPTAPQIRYLEDGTSPDVGQNGKVDPHK